MVSAFCLRVKTWISICKQKK